MTEVLADLESLTRMVLDRDLARLEELARNVAERKSAVAELVLARDERAAALSGQDAGEDLAVLTGRDHLWQDWLHRELARRQTELARAKADFEAQRFQASKSFGRTEAFRQLRETEAAERHRIRARRGANRQAPG